MRLAACTRVLHVSLESLPALPWHERGGRALRTGFEKVLSKQRCRVLANEQRGAGAYDERVDADLNSRAGMTRASASAAVGPSGDAGGWIEPELTVCFM